MRCQICESELSERALFCEVCGNRVRRVTPQPEAPQPRAAPRPTASRSATAFAPPAPSPSAPILRREELSAAVQARAELGERLEPEVLDSFLDRIEQAVVQRVDEQVDLRLRGVVRGRIKDKQSQSISLPVAICSLIFGIPLSAIAGEDAGLAGLIVAWLGIAAVNLAVNLRPAPDDSPLNRPRGR
jgi:hypothetical protein